MGPPEGLTLKGPVLTGSEEGVRGGSSGEGTGAELGPEARRHQEQGTGAPEASSFFRSWWASVNPKTILRRGNFRFLVMFGSRKMPLKIGVPFGNLRAVVVQLSFKKRVDARPAWLSGVKR